MQGNDVSGHRNVLNTFATHLCQKYEHIVIDQTCVTRLQRVIPLTCPTKYAEVLEQPLTIEELSSALRSGAKHKTPGIDGFSLEFYIANWDNIKQDLLELMNQMFLHKKITPQQKHGLIVCLSKFNGDRTPNGYRPISLLTTEYKLLARMMARRLRHILKDHLHTRQFFGVPGRSILEAASLVRDAIAYSETSGSPLCVLTLEFQHVFDRISHHHLYQILHRYGISEWFIERLHALYENATASVQINGTLAGPIPIQNAVRQGCPLGMILYVLCLHPLLRTLEDNLPGIRLGRSTRSPPVVATADDVTVLVTQPGDFAIIHEAVRCYEKVTGAKLNSKKPKALPIGGGRSQQLNLELSLTTKLRSWGSNMEPPLQNR